MPSALHYLELTELSRRIHAREISPVEATTAQLTRIEKSDGLLKSYAHMMAEAALIQARAAEAEIMRGEIRGPLHGVPIAVKDLCWTQGVPTAAGMTIYQRLPSHRGCHGGAKAPCRRVPSFWASCN